MNWTDERVEKLKRLWAEGLSASLIATQLGGVSRNAVIGKVHRLKLSGRGRASSTTPRAKKTAPSAPKAPRPSRPVATSIGATALQVRFDAEPNIAPAPRLTSISAPVSRNLVLLELSERTCKWPNGDPLHEEFSFCGNDVGESGPYCGYHARVAYQPVADRRRNR